jgi:hypothetical protein
MIHLNKPWSRVKVRVGVSFREREREREREKERSNPNSNPYLSLLSTIISKPSISKHLLPLTLGSFSSSSY